MIGGGGGGGGGGLKKKRSVKQVQQPGSTDFSFAPNAHKTVEACSHATIHLFWLLSCEHNGCCCSPVHAGIRLECRHSSMLLVLHHVLAEKKQIF